MQQLFHALPFRRDTPNNSIVVLFDEPKILSDRSKDKASSSTQNSPRLTIPSASRLAIAPHSDGNDPVSLFSSTVIRPANKNSDQTTTLDSFFRRFGVDHYRKSNSLYLRKFVRYPNVFGSALVNLLLCSSTSTIPLLQARC